MCLASLLQGNSRALSTYWVPVSCQMLSFNLPPVLGYQEYLKLDGPPWWRSTSGRGEGGVMPSKVSCHLRETLTLFPTGSSEQRHIQGEGDGSESKQKQEFLVVLKSLLPVFVKVAYPLDGGRTSHLGQKQS